MMIVPGGRHPAVSADSQARVQSLEHRQSRHRLIRSHMRKESRDQAHQANRWSQPLAAVLKDLKDEL